MGEGNNSLIEGRKKNLRRNIQFSSKDKSENSILFEKQIIEPKTIPLWLQESELFKNMVLIGIEFYSDLFTKDHIIRTSDISNITDFIRVIRCSNFWGLTYWPISIYDFAFTHSAEVRAWRSANKDNYFAQHADLSDDLLGVLSDKHSFTLNVSALGSVGWLRYGHLIGRTWGAATCSAAAGGGYLACLKYAHENGCPWDQITCSYAAVGGHFSCLEYAHANGCPWDERTCSYAARYGHLKCLQYAHVNGCPWGEETCVVAVREGNLACLQYAHNNNCPWDERTCSDAAKYGHLDCLVYAHVNGCPWSKQTCINAAAGGHLPCLEYAHSNGCPWDANACVQAAKEGHRVKTEVQSKSTGGK